MKLHLLECSQQATINISFPALQKQSGSATKGQGKKSKSVTTVSASFPSSNEFFALFNAHSLNCSTDLLVCYINQVITADSKELFPVCLFHGI